MNFCSCDSDGDYQVASKICHARVPHVCDECSGKIKPGHLMEMIIYGEPGVGGGSAKRCTFCATLAERMGCSTIGGMRDDLMVFLGNDIGAAVGFFGRELSIQIVEHFRLPPEYIDGV